MINKFENELNKILKNCELCKAKMCGLCPNGKRKKNLKDELKKANPIYYLNHSKNTNLLLLHSSIDPLVEINSVKEYYNKYIGEKEMIIINDKMHIGLCISPFYFDCEEKNIYTRWIKQFD